MIIAVTAGALALAACGMEPYELQRSQEIPDGPGVFSGSKGEFTLSPARRPVVSPVSKTGQN